jgi:dTDP-4-dehydrorhamnose 3,5-epimerase
MLIQPTENPDLAILLPRRFQDARGFFVESYSRRRLAKHGFTYDFVQDNLSLSTRVGTVRGLHFQRPPMAQAKLVSVLRGAIFDVAVDLRQGSPWYGCPVAVRLSAEEGNQLVIPAGFAHGFCTLEPDTVVAYKVDAYYSAEDDDGLYWADPALGIDWPVTEAEAELSDKDRRLPKLADVARCFVHDRNPTA